MVTNKFFGRIKSISPLLFIISACISIYNGDSFVYAAEGDVIVSVEEAHKLLANKNVRFLFADSEKDYANGHIPGSLNAFAHDLQFLEDVRKCKGLPMCEPTAFNFIGKELGIDSSTDVVVYDNGMGVNASGVWFFLTLYGLKNVRIMDGGLPTWVAKGFPVDKDEVKVAGKTFKGSVQWDMIANRQDVEKATKDSSKYLIVDARHTLEEYTGKTLQSGLLAHGKEVAVARGGFIPTAVFSPWTKYASNKSGDANKPIFKEQAELAKQLEKLKKNGYDSSKQVISYCHVGLGRGSFQYLALKRAGHQNVKVYVGSWSEWGNTPELPLGKSDASQSQ